MTPARTRLLRLLAAVAAVVALAAPRGTPARAAGEPYEINAVLSLTGSAAFLGQEEKQALEAVEKVTNAHGGIRGRPVRFTVQDDQSNPQIAVQLTRGVMDKHVPVILGSSLVAICNAMMAVVKDAGPMQYCFSPGIHPDRSTYTFSSSVSTKDLALIMVRYFHKRGWNRIAVMTSTDATGQDAEHNFDAAFAAPENKGTQLVAREHFNPSDVTVAAQLQRVKAANPQVLVAWTTGTPFGTVLRDIAGSGLDIPIGAGNWNIIYAQMKQYTKFLPKELYFAGVQYFRDPKDIRGPLRAPIEEFDKAVAPSKPDLGQGLGYDPAMIVVDALRHVGTNATAAQLRDYVDGLHGYIGTHGVYDFRAGDHRGLGVGNAVMVRYDAAKELFVAVSKPGGDPLR
ncbi:MAG TPA: ABC transporter substrate-binding protein [Candidatus Elarobacter sp.]|nr:ABC transporter substrate-binding protein [Candidatus Elarobacter sp.]